MLFKHLINTHLKKKILLRNSFSFDIVPLLHRAYLTFYLTLLDFEIVPLVRELMTNSYN